MPSASSPSKPAQPSWMSTRITSLSSRGCGKDRRDNAGTEFSIHNSTSVDDGETELAFCQAGVSPNVPSKSEEEEPEVKKPSYLIDVVSLASL